MKGHVTRKRDHYYAVICEGLDPITGKECQAWHPVGTDRAEAEALVARLAAERDDRNDEVRSLTFADYLSGHWLPAKRLEIRISTHRNYIRKAQRRKWLRRLRPKDLERLYDSILHPTDGTRPLARKTVDEVHLIIRDTRDHPLHRRLETRNIALAASAPRLRAIPKAELKAWTATELQTLLYAVAGRRLFPALWLSANSGIRRNELLGLRWTDLHTDHALRSINRGLVAVSYEIHEARGKTGNSRRCINLDQTTLGVLAGWRALQAAEYDAIGVDDPRWMFTTATGEPAHPRSISRAFDRIARRALVPVSDCTTCATPTAACSSTLPASSKHSSRQAPPKPRAAQSRLNTRENTSPTTKARVRDLGLRRDVGGRGGTSTRDLRVMSDPRPLLATRSVPSRTSEVRFRTYDVPVRTTANRLIPARGVEAGVEQQRQNHDGSALLS